MVPWQSCLLLVILWPIGKLIICFFSKESFHISRVCSWDSCRVSFQRSSESLSPSCHKVFSSHILSSLALTRIGLVLLFIGSCTRKTEVLGFIHFLQQLCPNSFVPPPSMEAKIGEALAVGAAEAPLIAIMIVLSLGI